MKKTIVKISPEFKPFDVDYFINFIDTFKSSIIVDLEKIDDIQWKNINELF